MPGMHCAPTSISLPDHVTLTEAWAHTGLAGWPALGDKDSGAGVMFALGTVGLAKTQRHMLAITAAPHERVIS